MTAPCPCCSEARPRPSCATCAGMGQSADACSRCGTELVEDDRIDVVHGLEAICAGCSADQRILLRYVEGIGGKVTMLYERKVAFAWEGERYVYELSRGGDIVLRACSGAELGSRHVVCTREELRHVEKWYW